MIAIALFTGFSAKAQQKQANDAFWSKLQTHSGKAYKGTLTEGRADALTKGEMVMHVRFTSDSVIKIPFFVGDDRSRTWVLKRQNGKILLKHDHRHEDGTPDKVTQYGGWTPNSGSPRMQFFPADEETAKLLPSSASNIWWITIDDQFFTYNLRRVNSNTPITVKFDLSQPVTAPAAPWGWKE